MDRVIEVPSAAIVELRRAVLRDGRTDLDILLPRDAEPTTVHLGAFDGDELIGCVTLARKPSAAPIAGFGLHLCQMAVAPAHQGTGVGRALLTEAMRRADEAGVGIWAAARVTAVDFYLAHGFEVTGDQFTGAMGLPHRWVVRAPVRG